MAEKPKARPEWEGLPCELTFQQAVDILEIIDHCPGQEMSLEWDGLKLEIVKQ